MARHQVVVRSVAVVALAAAVAAGCGDESGGAGGAGQTVEQELSGLPGVQDVSVTEDRIEDGGDPTTEIVVSLEPATPDEDVVGVLEVLAGSGQGRNAALIDAPGSDWQSDAQPGVSGVRNVQPDSDPQEATEILRAGLQLADELGGEAAVDVDFNPYAGDVDRAVTITPASPSTGDVRAAVDGVEADPVLREAQAVVSGQDFPVG